MNTHVNVKRLMELDITDFSEMAPGEIAETIHRLCFEIQETDRLTLQMTHDLVEEKRRSANDKYNVLQVKRMEKLISKTVDVLDVESLPESFIRHELPYLQSIARKALKNDNHDCEN